MGLELRLLNVSTIADIDAAFATFANERPDALFISSGPFFNNRRVQLAHLATRHALATISMNRGFPEVGGLMS
jgi:putative tryptophan/tyrosine transport system substrate-binding protein